MLNPFDSVIALVRLSERIKEGTHGVVLLVLDEERPMYEVEFVDEQGDSVEVLSVLGSTIQAR